MAGLFLTCAFFVFNNVCQPEMWDIHDGVDTILCLFSFSFWQIRLIFFFFRISQIVPSLLINALWMLLKTKMNAEIEKEVVSDSHLKCRPLVNVEKIWGKWLICIVTLSHHTIIWSLINVHSTRTEWHVKETYRLVNMVCKWCTQWFLLKYWRTKFVIKIYKMCFEVEINIQTHFLLFIKCKFDPIFER